MRDEAPADRVPPGPTAPSGEAPREAATSGGEPSGEGALADVVRAPIGQVSRAVRDDVGRLRYLIVSIRTPYTVLGLLLHLATAALGTGVAFLGGFPDWPMHAGLHLVLLSLVLLYFRAGLRGFRVRRVLYCALTAFMLLFFAWILVDLIPARPELTAGVDFLSEDGPPAIILREEAPLLGWVAGGLCATALWLVVHMAMVRTRRMR